ncbi:mechanosensitive ion channel family protein [Paludibacterium purpuratum]|uniref:Mechanosensitive ion channel-like protein n=1 Tax=Paludibacterium purpuratum TaxID=1144873 RepID=A0A4R7BDW7_9NEIS|nr:mechanosensitive ion channel domain-containing protein [Paludibacterium purpuratum]TDR81956.1 mechanosensitive ion channel-like protein [Paludibacterium purpuratum]
MFFRRDEMSVDALLGAMQTWAGLTELCIGVLCVLFGWRLSREVYRRYFADNPARYDHFLPYAGLRLIMPLSAEALLLLFALVWGVMLHHRPHVLLAFSATLFWLGLIRLLTAVVREILPRGRFERRTEHILASLSWLAFVTWAIQLDDFAVEWMESISFRVGKVQLDLSMVLGALLWVSVIMFVALWVSRLVERRLMRLNELDLSLRLVFSKLARTVLMVTAVLIALPIVGIDLTVLSVFGGALGVGLGFGLQKIASSYISGFIILLDRSIRIGDRLTIGDRVGNVTKITSRFVVLKSGDGSEALIPNETMIASTVINQSYSDSKIWSSVKVDVAYDTDLELALRLLEEAARQPRVVDGPKGFVTLFGASGITLEVGFWVADPENGFLGLKSDIHMAIWRLFREHGVQMPFPQMEVSVKRLPGGGEA